MKTKYVAFKDLENDIEDIIIFPETIMHRDMARAMERLYHQPISAGFVQLSKDGPLCYGRSESLNLDSRGEVDTKLARDLL